MRQARRRRKAMNEQDREREQRERAERAEYERQSRSPWYAWAMRRAGEELGKPERESAKAGDAMPMVDCPLHGMKYGYCEECQFPKQEPGDCAAMLSWEDVERQFNSAEDRIIAHALGVRL